MNQVVFGKYSPRNTFVHKLDARNKIFILILLMVTIFIPFKTWSTALAISLLILLILIGVMISSKVRVLDLFKSLASMWILIIFLMIIYIFIPNSNYKYEAFNIGKLTIYYDAFYQTGFIFIRLLLIISLTMILTSTTKTMDMTYAFEWYLTPLRLVKFPSHIVSMTMSLALRFIPTLLDETERIKKAQESRGVDYDHGGIFKRIRSMTSLIIPLLFSSIARSEELANAMEARGYDPYEKRTRYKALKFTWRDLIAVLLCLILFGGILTMNIIDKRSGFDLFKLLGMNLGF